ncbi:MAG: hypothetical protein H6741_29740 [Alphaproteobacteria bacterium]|nr:hypothetical protein [Alphaproteobacteria bacterium]MCB9796905.1 hypothetical protein [Alphaproteobacteria bacterium]
MRLSALLLLLAGCGDELGYETCDVADDCSEVVPEDATAACVEKADSGFCSWECDVDDDCATDADEDFTRVCASFESSPELYCFPSCEESADSDGAEACPEGFTCRSTGGGSDNRRVCFPSD